jgi:hypothetical protein
MEFSLGTAVQEKPDYFSMYFISLSILRFL